MSQEISCMVLKPLGILSEDYQGCTKEINLIRWNEAPAQIDIRVWQPEHRKCYKGVTLSEKEGRKLLNALIRFYAETEKTD